MLLLLRSNKKPSPKTFTNYLNSQPKQPATKSRKLSEGYPSSFILIEMQAIKHSQKYISKSNGPTKFSLMYPKEIPTIFLDNKVFHKLKKDPNLREVISEQIWPSLSQLTILEERLSTASEGDKFVNIAKVQVILQELFILAIHVVELVKWSEKSRLKIKWKMFKWNAKSVMEVDTPVNISAQFAMDKKLYSNQETYTLKSKKVWELVTKFFLKASQSKDLNFIQEMFIWPFINLLMLCLKDRRMTCWWTLIFP